MPRPDATISREALHHYEKLSREHESNPIDVAVEAADAVSRAARRFQRARRALEDARGASHELIVSFVDAGTAYRCEAERHYFAAGYALGAKVAIAEDGKRSRAVRSLARRLVEVASFSDLPRERALRALLDAARAFAGGEK